MYAVMFMTRKPKAKNGPIYPRTGHALSAAWARMSLHLNSNGKYI